jgi:glycosyltransferase involved in cell wall biosynthesis
MFNSLRTAHLERLPHMEPADVVYRRGRYDFDLSLLPAENPPRRMGRWRMLGELVGTRYSVVELNEPLLLALWRQLLWQVPVLRLRSRLTRRPVAISGYCIDFGDPAAELARRRFMPAWLAPVVVRLGVRFLVRGFDRLAFGTEGSLRLYAQWAGEDLVRSRGRLFPSLAAPCRCPEEAPGVHPDTRFVFVGAFLERKGIRQLLAAWEEIERTADRPVSLRIIGHGALETVVRTWAEGRPSVTVDIDPPRTEIHRALRAADVLVLLSQREGHWREQIGLPILEGLSHGTEVVATDETGIAGWLAEHGHQVVGGSAGASATAEALLAAARGRRDRHEILADLPEVDGRLAADTWLMTGEDPTGSGQDAGAVLGATGADPQVGRVNEGSPVRGRAPGRRRSSPLP